MGYSHDVVDNVDTLTKARVEMIDAYNAARERAIATLNGEHVDADDEDDVADYLDGPIHCGTCMSNVVIREIEPVLFAYVRRLEWAVGMDPIGGAS